MSKFVKIRHYSGKVATVVDSSARVWLARGWEVVTGAEVEQAAVQGEGSEPAPSAPVPVTAPATPPAQPESALQSSPDLKTEGTTPARDKE